MNKTEENIVLEGTVISVMYRNEENGYIVFKIDTPGGTFAVTGYSSYLEAGEKAELHGTFVNHREYGKQFKAAKITSVLPESANAILDYLCAGAVKGIGPITAKRIVDKYGSDSLHIIENNPEELAKFPSITPKKAREISAYFSTNSCAKKAIVELEELSLPPFICVKAYKLLGSTAAAIIRKDPYILTNSELSLPFEQADSLALTLEFDMSGNTRILAGIKHILKHNIKNGHTFLPYDKLTAAASGFLQCETDVVEDVIEDAAKHHELFITTISGREAVYLDTLYKAELYSAEKLLKLSEHTFNENIDINTLIDNIEKSEGIKYTDMQKRAIKKAVTGGVLVLTGGPGTGKTTVLKGILTAFKKLSLSYELAAPTGRAAKRMEQVTGESAKTVHRLLETVAQKHELKFLKDENNPISTDCVIIDEVSMVDSLLLESLLRATKLGTRLILVGDSDQLPPVGPGLVLRDIIKSELFEVVALKEIFRQAEQSLIVTNAHAVNNGNYPELSKTDNDFFFIERKSEDIAKTIVSLVKERLPLKGFNPLTDVQITSPTKRGENGTVRLNKLLQDALNPQEKNKKQRIFMDTIFREGDKVMQIKNNYDIFYVRKQTGECGTGIMNGEIGIITAIDHMGEKLTVDFDGAEAEIPFEYLPDLELAYCVTVHKMQGNEFPCVIMPSFLGSDLLFNRNLLYTAITRARSMMLLVGSPGAINRMVDNDKQTRRYCGLRFILSKQV